MNIGISTTNQGVFSINTSITNLRVKGSKHIFKKVNKVSILKAFKNQTWKGQDYKSP